MNVLCVGQTVSLLLLESGETRDDLNLPTFVKVGEPKMKRRSPRMSDAQVKEAGVLARRRSWTNVAGACGFGSFWPKTH